MAADFPRMHASCGGTLKRRFTTVAVHYAVAGFAATDDRLLRQVGTERYARFEQERNAALARAKTGRQNAYEQALEAI